MRALAGFIMRGRMQATLVVAAGAAIPLLFWLGAAAASLVLLRRGLQDAAGVVGWALLPALVWWYFGEPRSLLVLAGTLGLAAVLRSRVSWTWVLMCSVPVGLVYGLTIAALFGEPIAVMADELARLMPQLLGDLGRLDAAQQAHLSSLLAPVLTGLMAALLQLLSLLSLMLARHWQALLYNPGGFGREFRALRLPPPAMLALLAGMLIGPNLSVQLAMLVSLCSVPLAVAGTALVHGLVGAGALGRFWLVGLYVTLLVFAQLIYPFLVVLAIIDSLIDFRGRLARKRDADSTKGEG